LSTASPARRAAIGFQGGQVLSLRLSDDQLNSLRTTLREGRERWQEVEASDGAVLVDIGQVVYLRVESDDHRIGF
jgi:prefoldin subunit 5